MQMLSNPISALNVRESRKFARLERNRGRGTRWWRQILDRKWKCGRFAHAQWKVCNISLIYGWIAQIFASSRKSRDRGTQWWRQLFHRKWKYDLFACAVKNVQYNYLHLWPNRQNVRDIKGNRGWGTRWWRQILDQKWKYGCSRMRNWNMHYNLYLSPNCQTFCVPRKSLSRKTIVTSDLRAEVEIWPFRACEDAPSFWSLAPHWLRHRTPAW